jgi:hypothetical protein
MRILLGLNNQLNSNIFGSRFLKNSPKTFEFKILGYYKNHHFLENIDYVIDGLKGNQNYFSEFGFRETYPKIGTKLHSTRMKYVLNDLKDWKPDVVVSDFEIISARLSVLLDVPLYYCNSIFSLHSFMFGFIFSEQKKLYPKYPYSDHMLVYSPLCNMQKIKTLKNGYQWVQPYTEDEIKEENFYIDDECIITSGSTSYLSDALLKKEHRRMIFNPHDFSDFDMRTHAELFDRFEIGVDIGKHRKLSFIQMAKEKLLKNYTYEKNNDIKYLHEILREELEIK